MVRDIGEKEKISMKNRIKYTDELVGELRVIKDFLPFRISWFSMKRI
jgi:hypothetical protein